MNQPNAGFNFSPETLLLRPIPIKIPAMEKAVNGDKKFQLTVVLERLPAKEDRQFIVMISKEVPMALRIGSFKNNTNAGMIRKPPPAPIKPVSVPTTNPDKMIDG